MRKVASLLNTRGFFPDRLLNAVQDSADPGEETAKLLDIFLKHAEEILNMYPPGLELTVKIFDGDSFLADEYYKLFGERKAYKAFYIHERKTIYTSSSGISDSVMIHEMAHAVVDNYFSVNLPSKISEVLASYVDLHLAD